MANVGRGAEQFTVRFPDGMRDRIKRAAADNGRSMNTEIVATLEEKYPKPSLEAEKIIKLLLSLGASSASASASTRNVYQLIISTFEEGSEDERQRLNDFLMAVPFASLNLKAMESIRDKASNNLSVDDLSDEEIEALLHTFAPLIAIRQRDGEEKFQMLSKSFFGEEKEKHNRLMNMLNMAERLPKLDE